MDEEAILANVLKTEHKLSQPERVQTTELLSLQRERRTCNSPVHEIIINSTDAGSPTV